MKVVKIKNENYYDKTFFGISVTIRPPEYMEEGKTEEVLDPHEFEVLNKNCPNFQQFTNPPEHGGTPRIRVLGSTPDGKVRLNAKELGKPTMFTAPEVRLRGDDITEVPKETFNRLKGDNRFQSLVDSGELKIMGEDEK